MRHLTEIGVGGEPIHHATARTRPEIFAVIDQMLDQADLPTDPNSRIVLKPNLNSDLPAVVGNATDLRVIHAVVAGLQRRGYTDITVADGPNVGIDRLGIDVFDRLGLRALADHLGIALCDLNHTEGKETQLATPRPTRIATLIREADYLINLPKLKTHAEAGLSLCLKNLVGINVGVEKKRVHDALAENIVALNETVRPDFHIVDALIAMEGNGPGDGRPRRLDWLFSGSDPFLIDGCIARMTGFALSEVPALLVARRKGHIGEEAWRALESLPTRVRIEKPPPRRWLARVLTHNRMTWFRDLTRPIFSRKPVMRLLYHLRLLQDIYDARDATIEALYFDPERCPDCPHGATFCPADWEAILQEAKADEGRLDLASAPSCLRCLNCLWVCPEGAVQLVGEAGYLTPYLEKYRHDLLPLPEGKRGSEPHPRGTKRKVRRKIAETR